MDELSICRSVDLAAPRERVWAAIDDEYRARSHEVVELEQDEVVAFRREHPGTDATTLARFTLIDIPGGTRLTVVESGFEQLEDPDAAARDHENRWEAELGELQALLSADAPATDTSPTDASPTDA
jgi:uncharacterized protein YndB with AHSA1/START domain